MIHKGYTHPGKAGFWSRGILKYGSWLLKGIPVQHPLNITIITTGRQQKGNRLKKKRQVGCEYIG